jgi:hypothetical protein
MEFRMTATIGEQKMALPMIMAQDHRNIAKEHLRR